ASASMSKDCTPQELIAAIRRRYAQRMCANGHEGPRSHREAVEALASRAGLTPREKMVLRLIVDTEFTNQQVARALTNELGEPVPVSSVKHALDRAAAKLGTEPRTRAALIKRVLEFERHGAS